MYEMLTDETLVAGKDYNCDAFDWIDNTDNPSDYMSFSDRKELVKARRNKFKIKKGDVYVKQTGKYDGDFITFRAIPDLHAICIKYDLYED